MNAISFGFFFFFPVYPSAYSLVNEYLIGHSVSKGLIDKIYQEIDYVTLNNRPYA